MYDVSKRTLAIVPLISSFVLLRSRCDHCRGLLWLPVEFSRHRIPFENYC